MSYRTGSVFKMNSLADMEINSFAKEEQIIIKNISNTIKPDYLFFIKEIDGTHALCTCMFSSPHKKTTKVPCTNDYDFWIKEKCTYILNYLALSPIDIKLEIPDLINYSNNLIRKYNQRTTSAAKKQQNRAKKKERSAKNANNKHQKQISRQKKKKFEEKLRKTAMSDPRFFADEGVVKNDGRGKAPRYKSKWANSQYNIDHPVSAGRGNA